MVFWQPDTCGCKFEVATDWKSAKTVFSCPHHSAATDPFVAVRNENAFKNMAVARVVESLPDYDGTFSYDTGSLALTLPATLSEKQQAAIQDDLTAHFGGDVKVV